MATKTATTIKPFASLNAALDALDNAEGLKNLIGGAAEDLDTATSVETMEDFKANLETAAQQLRSALANIEKMIGRC